MKSVRRTRTPTEMNSTAGAPPPGTAAPRPQTSRVSLWEGWLRMCRAEARGGAPPTVHPALSPPPRPRPAHPPSQVADCCAGTCAGDPASGVSHPAEEQSLIYALWGRSRWSRDGTLLFSGVPGHLEAEPFQRTLILRTWACDSVWARWEEARRCRGGGGPQGRGATGALPQGRGATGWGGALPQGRGAAGAWGHGGAAAGAWGHGVGVGGRCRGGVGPRGALLRGRGPRAQFVRSHPAARAGGSSGPQTSVSAFLLSVDVVSLSGAHALGSGA